MKPEILYEGRYLALQMLDDWEFATRPNSRAVVGVLAITDDGEVVLVEQFRRPLQKSVIELPAGLVGDEIEFADESLADCAARELLEETGYRAGKIEPLLASPTSAGMTDEITHLFLATELTQEHDGGGVGDEQIETHLVPVDYIDAWLYEKQNCGLAIDFKIHAALWCATQFPE